MEAPRVFIIILLFAGTIFPAESRGDFEAGRSNYEAAEFKKAAAHFERALKAEPNDAAASFWLGKSYQMLSDIDGPLFGARAFSKARRYLAKAVELQPGNQEYRRELFNLLLETGFSASALAPAESIIRMVPPSDPDYRFMMMRLEQERQARSSPEYRVLRTLSAIPHKVASLNP